MNINIKEHAKLKQKAEQQMILLKKLLKTREINRFKNLIIARKLKRTKSEFLNLSMMS